MKSGLINFQSLFGSVAQSVEQRTENPCVGGSIPSRATISGSSPSIEEPNS